MYSDRPASHPLNLASWGIWALDLLSWLILLAGVSALQKECNIEGASSDCSKAYSLQWWNTWLESTPAWELLPGPLCTQRSQLNVPRAVFVLLVVAGSLAAGFLSTHRLIHLTLLAIITTLLILDCQVNGCCLCLCYSFMLPEY